MPGFISEKSDEGKQLTDLYQLDAKIRGRYLIQANWIEDHLSEIISMHFRQDAEEKHDLLHSIINKNINFRQKISIFLKILEEYFPEYQFEKMKKDLEKVRAFRNRIAHSVLDTSDEFLEKKYDDRINLQYYENGETKHQSVTVEDIESSIDLTIEILEELIRIIEYIDKLNQKTT